MSWIVLVALLQIEEKKIDREPSLLPVQPGQTMWASKLEIDVAKMRAQATGLLTEKPTSAHVELSDNLGDGLLATVRDASGRAFATAVMKRDGLAEFAHLRSLGALVIRDRFLGPKGEAEPWGVFLVDDKSGEVGKEVPESEVKGKKIRRTYAVYVTAPNEFVWADYDPDGKLTNAGKTQGMATTIDHTRDRQKGGPHGIWAETKMPLQTDHKALPDAAVKKGMTDGFLVTRFEGGAYWRVKTYDKDAKETKTVCLKFAALPFDAAFDKLAGADKQKWKP